MTEKPIGDTLIIKWEMGCGMRRKLERLSKLPFVTGILVILNAGIFLICTFSGEMLYNIGDISPDSFFGRREYYRALSAMFLHADITHIVNNMLLLAGLGAMLEIETGHMLFLAEYLWSGLGGQAASLGYKLLTGKWFVSSIGASGAVFGLVGVLLAAVMSRTRSLQSVTWQRVALVAAYSIYSGIRSANIDNAAHIGGFVSGFLLGAAAGLFRKLCGERQRRRNREGDRYEY